VFGTCPVHPQVPCCVSSVYHSSYRPWPRSTVYECSHSNWSPSTVPTLYIPIPNRRDGEVGRTDTERRSTPYSGPSLGLAVAQGYLAVRSSQYPHIGSRRGQCPSNPALLVLWKGILPRGFGFRSLDGPGPSAPNRASAQQRRRFGRWRIETAGVARQNARHVRQCPPAHHGASPALGSEGSHRRFRRHCLPCTLSTLHFSPLSLSPLHPLPERPVAHPAELELRVPLPRLAPARRPPARRRRRRPVPARRLCKPVLSSSPSGTVVTVLVLRTPYSCHPVARSKRLPRRPPKTSSALVSRLLVIARPS